MRIHQDYSKIAKVSITLIVLLIIASCATKKRKGDVSKLAKFYHNVTSEYNGYFNANELMIESEKILRESAQENYSQLLPVYDFVSVPDPKIVNGQLDKAIEKVARVATVHAPGDWVDDSYVLMGKAQYLKQDYATTVETFEYFQKEFNPTNPYGRNYQKIRLNGKTKEDKKARQKSLEDQRKAKEKEREEDRKAVEKQREEDKKAREQAAKERSQAAKDRKNRTPARTGARIPKTVTPAPDTTGTVAKATPTTPTVGKPAEEDAPVAKVKPKQERSDGTAYNEGIMYLAMAYTQMENYSNAAYLLNRLNELSGHTEQVKVGLAPAMAELYIKTGKDDQAIAALEDAIKTAKRKELKGRYNFIIGQILQNRGDYNSAATYFDNAGKKSGRNFKMKFMAELYKLKNEALRGARSSNDVANKLDKMLKEDKNKEYKDQIYFAMAEVELGRNNTPQAKTYFASSIANNKGNSTLKAECYYSIANMYISEKNYSNAKNYLDSTLVNLPKTDKRYDPLAKQAAKMANTAIHMAQVIKMDSLIVLSKLSPKELDKLAKDRIASNTAKGSNSSTVNPNNGDSNPNKSYTRSIMGNSSFFAYNPITVETGKTDFKSTWGLVKLEDDWRRSSRGFASTISGSEAAAVDVQKEVKITDEQIKAALADIPLDDASKSAMQSNLSDELFETGKALKVDMEEAELSNKYLERVIGEYPDYVRRLDVMYMLYRNYLELGNVTMANKYKTMIINEFPESNFAKIITDPNYAAFMAQEKPTVERFYASTYEQFEQKNYTKVVDNVKNAEQLYGKDNPYMAKMTLLNAMCQGATAGKDAYLLALNEVVVRYPNTAEETKAKEIMRFLNGDEAALNTVNVEEVDNQFLEEDDSKHYVVVILFDYSDKVLQEAKIAVSDYNREYYKIQNLQLGEQILSKEDKTQLILVRPFDNKSRAYDYYLSVYKDVEKFIPTKTVGYELYPISQRNFRKLVAQKSHINYRAWFESKN